MAVEFAKQGANLLLAARREGRLSALAEQIGPDKAAICVCDVTKSEDLKNAVNIMRNRFGPISIAVANAGFAVGGSLDSLNAEDFRRQFETNVFGVLNTVYAVLDDLKKTCGQLVIIGSMNGYAAFPGASAYAMSKFAIRSLCDSLTHELSPYGISVTHIVPGYVHSEIRQIDKQGNFHADAPSHGPRWFEISSEECARQISHAVRHRKRIAVITWHAKIAVWMSNHFAGLVAAAFHFKAKRRAKALNAAAEMDDESTGQLA